jgi:glycosyltransferase involved in cell wall biosynthesis
MRIGYLYDFTSFPPKGGHHLHVIELIKGFLSLGHSVSVLEDPAMPGVTNFVSEKGGLDRFLESSDLIYVRIDAGPTRRWKSLSACLSKAGQRPVVWEINSPANEVLAYSWLAGREISRGKESTLRRIRRQIHAWRQLPVIGIEELHRRRLARRVDAAICVSSALGTYAQHELGINNVVVMPNGGPLLSDEEILERRARRNHVQFTVFYSGSTIFPWQGLDLLQQVIELAEKEAPDILFVLAVNKRTKGLPRTGNVLVLEALDRDQIFDAICAADVCVALHPDYSWSAYGFHNSPMKIFEYMACQRPVVTSNHGQMREIFRDGDDVLMCEYDARAVLAKLMYLKENGQVAKRLGRNGWELIQTRYNWPAIVMRTTELFEDLLCSKPNLTAARTDDRS